MKTIYYPIGWSIVLCLSHSFISAMGKVRPFCRSGPEANILRPYCGLLSVNFFIIMVCNILIHLIAPRAEMSESVKLFGSDNRYHDFIQLSIKSSILAYVLIAKFS